ncbi:hypothetical protein FGADI_10613 [Fusarium gaditjirri]|uniref:Transmembrane protein n=1 Tax=Fusarium gaditjirri TaxID=282569 RepID=A0A8H4SX37_9HYPO|nr:hypothetical protein FGADI_10613 [Fusarium gaditjirri]
MKSLLPLLALVASFLCLCCGANTGGSMTSSSSTDNELAWPSDFAHSVVSMYMLGPVGGLPSIQAADSTCPTNPTAHPITNPATHTTTVGTKNEQNVSSTNGSKSEIGPDMQFLKDQIDDLLEILRDIRSFVQPPFPGAARLVIIIALFSLLQERIGAACIKYGFDEATGRDKREEFKRALRALSAKRIIKSSFVVIITSLWYWFLVLVLWVASSFLGIVGGWNQGLGALFYEIRDTLWLFVEFVFWIPACPVFFVFNVMVLASAHLIGLVGYLLSPFRTKDEREWPV